MIAEEEKIMLTKQDSVLNQPNITSKHKHQTLK